MNDSKVVCEVSDCVTDNIAAVSSSPAPTSQIFSNNRTQIISDH